MTVPHVVVDARKAGDFGIGRYVVGLLGALAQRADLRVTALHRAADAALLPSGIGLVRAEAPGYSLRELVELRSRLSDLKPDLYHAPHYVLPFAPPARVVTTIHDVLHLTRPEHASPHRRLYARTMIGRAVRLSRRILTGSKAAAEALGDEFPAARPKTAVVPYGLDGAFRVEPTPVERARVRARHVLGGPYVLFLGNDQPHKNLAGLLEAFSLVRGAGRVATSLVLAGGSEARRAVRRRILTGLGIEGAVRDLGVVDAADVAPLLAGAEALVLPSFDEGFGLPVLEAQALGVPVVCSDRGGLPEAGGDAALYVSPVDAPSLATALERVLTETGLRQDLVGRGRIRAAAFTWERTAEETVQVYNEALRGGL